MKHQNELLESKLNEWFNDDMKSEIFKLTFYDVGWIDLWWHEPSDDLVRYMHSRGFGHFKKKMTHEGSTKDTWVWYPNLKNEKIAPYVKRATDLVKKLTNKIEAIIDEIQDGDRITISYSDKLTYDEADHVCYWLENQNDYPGVIFTPAHGKSGIIDYKSIQMLGYRRSHED